MTRYLEKSFSVGKSNSQQFRDNWEETFGKKEDPADEGEWRLEDVSFDDLPEDHGNPGPYMCSNCKDYPAGCKWCERCSGCNADYGEDCTCP